MTAISKAWVSVADSAVDPDSPLDSQLMTGLRDDLIHLREWLGASFEAGAVQDHNHDGSNSALIPVGPNLLRNGSFENGGTDGWTMTQYTGGTVATNTSNPLDGATSLAFTSTVLANGGGDATSNEFIPVTGGLPYTLNGAVKAGAANLSGKLEVLWFDNTQSSISTSVAFTSNSLPTSSTPVGGTVSAPATARYMTVKVTGHIAGSSAPVTTGTLYLGWHFIARSIADRTVRDARHLHFHHACRYRECWSTGWRRRRFFGKLCGWWRRISRRLGLR